MPEADYDERPRSPPLGLDLSLCLFGLLAFALKAWTCFCLFPLHAWNDVRLRPSYLIADGQALYPGLKQGLITTWMYGPAHPLLFLPVTFFRDIQSAYLAAGALNILQLALSLAFVCFLWPDEVHRRTHARSLIALATCLLVVLDAFYIILQADNTALICGLLSITCLVRNMTRSTALTLWGAAFFGVSAAFAKLHGAAVICGELIWLLIFYGPKKLQPLLTRSALCACAWCLLTLSTSSSPAAAMDHILALPSKLPWANDLVSKLTSLRTEFLLMVVLPGVLIALLYRLNAISRQASLPIIVWLTSLPLGVLSALKIGGSSNSLHGVYYLLPFFFIELGAGQANPRQRSVVRAIYTITLLGVGAFYFSAALRKFPSAPLMLHASQADYLARTHRDSIWLPWRPLASYLATGANYHDEDGLYARQLSGLYPSRNQARTGLPIQWSLTAIEVPGMIWNIAPAMQPTQGELSYWGDWYIYSFAPK